MFRTVAVWLALLVSFVSAAVPTPREHLGFTPGDDYKLADYAQISGYFQKLAASTNRMKLVQFGQTSRGLPMYLAIFSSPENLQRLDQYKALNRQLARGEAPDAAAAQGLAAQSKAIVWIDSGLHASEVAPAQHSPELAYKMITDESAEMKLIRHNVILLQIPCINPDGLDDIAHWYMKNVGTPYELAPLPTLYQKYAGHDNNRDWFMLNLQETRNVSRLLFQEWFPQIVYNQHQAPPFPARIFVPPYSEPLNPNIPAPVMEGINLIGAAMKERFAREGKTGVLSYNGFDAWWNGGLRSVPAFHNMHGILTETAGAGYATPRVYVEKDLPATFTATGMPTREPTVFYEKPYLGGKWGVRQAIDYMLTGDMAILELAASRPQQFLFKAWEMARANIDAGQKGGPFAYVLSPEQWDRSAANAMLQRLAGAGVTVQRARSAFSSGGKTYPEGTYVLPAAQPFRGYLVDLMEAQKYPELRAGANGAVKRPYDIAGWTLPLQMGVKVDRIETSFSADLSTVNEVPAYTAALEQRDNASFGLLAQRLKQGEAWRWTREGKLVTSGAAEFAAAPYRLKQPRVALYEPYTANMDAGWTQWVLDQHQISYGLLKNEDVRRGGLRERFDAVILAAQPVATLLHGTREGERGRSRDGELPAQQRPEFTGGLGITGIAALEEFVRAGGTLLTFDTASELPVQFFGLPVRGFVAAAAAEGPAEGSAAGYYCPGSLLKVTVDSKNPLAFGMPDEAIIFSNGGQAWESTLLPEFNKGDRQVRSIAKYAAKNVLASGFLQGEKTIAGRDAMVEARLGKGRVVLFGFRPQHRGQTFGTFKLVLNALYLSAAEIAE